MKISEVHVRGTSYCCDLYLKHKVSLIIDKVEIYQTLVDMLKSRRNKDKVCIPDKSIVLVVTKNNWHKYVSRILHNKVKYLVVTKDHELLYDKEFRVMINRSNKTKFLFLLNKKLYSLNEIRVYDYGEYEIKEIESCYYNKKIA